MRYQSTLARRIRLSFESIWRILQTNERVVPMLVVVLLLPAIIAIGVFYAYANLLQRMLDKRQTRDQKRLCALLTFLFVAALMFCMVAIQG